MPTFEQKQDGDYFIRARVSSKDSIITWQVSAGGVTFLNKHGVHVGEKFSHSLLHEMIQSNLVSTGGSGIQSSGTQGKLFRTAYSPVEKVNETLPINKKASMMFKKYKRRWEILVAFPEIPVFWVGTKNSLNGCRLQLDGATESLKAVRLLPGTGGASLPVALQESTYKVRLMGTWPTHLRGWIQDIEGLKPSGTVFKKDEEGIRLSEHEPMLAGKSYYMIIRTTNQVMPFPRKIEMHYLGSQGIWEAWEVSLPKMLDYFIRSWCASIGYAISDFPR